MGCWCRGKRIGKGATYRRRGVSAFLPIVLVLVVVLDFPFSVQQSCSSSLSSFRSTVTDNRHRQLNPCSLPVAWTTNVVAL
jgi:hypothetical protein